MKIIHKTVFSLVMFLNVCTMFSGGKFKFRGTVFDAALKGNLSLLLEVLEKNPDVINRHNVEYFDNTPLHAAAYKGNLPAVELLVARGADLTACNKFGEIPLHTAIVQGKLKVACYLIRTMAEKGISLRDIIGRNTDTLLHTAAYAGHASLVTLLIDLGMCVNVEREKDGETPLHLASLKGHKEVVEVLCRRGADIDKVHRYQTGETALHIASYRGHYHIVRILLEYNGKVDKKNRFKYTALHLAASQGHIKTMKALIAAGATVNTYRFKNRTPLHDAVRSGQESSVKLLLDSGANPYVVDSEGMTPAMYAAKLNIENISALLSPKDQLHSGQGLMKHHENAVSRVSDNIYEILMEDYDALDSDDALPSREPIPAVAPISPLELIKEPDFKIPLPVKPENSGSKWGIMSLIQRLLGKSS